MQSKDIVVSSKNFNLIRKFFAVFTTLDSVANSCQDNSAKSAKKNLK
jgi:hypothetical protein